MDIKSKIVHERSLVVIFNYAYDFIGEGLVSDAIYEYTVNNLRELRRDHPEAWNSCSFYGEYFVDNDDWEYTGSGVPLTEQTKRLHAEYVSNGKTLWRSATLLEHVE